MIVPEPPDDLDRQMMTDTDNRDDLHRQFSRQIQI